jgi:hypothetical protein
MARLYVAHFGKPFVTVLPQAIQPGKLAESQQGAMNIVAIERSQHIELICD